MDVPEAVIQAAAIATDVGVDDLRAILIGGRRKIYGAGEYLFHESMPRRWVGIIEDGEVELLRGLHGSATVIAVLGKGAMIGEGALLSELPHTASAVTRSGATVWQVSNETWEKVREQQPEIFYRVVARASYRVNERLRAASAHLERSAGGATASVTRREHDLLGWREVPDGAYYGIQTLRAVENFPLSGIRLAQFAHFVNALAYVKKAAALANSELGVLDNEKAQAIAFACNEILAGKLHDQFVVDMFQGGAGTSTNMNANEVIANRALELLGQRRGAYEHLHPNDAVNCSQSTNDAYPTAIKIALIFSLKDTLGAMGGLKQSLEAKAHEFADVIKMGRTENQDAVPMTLGQEFSAYAIMVGDAMRALTYGGTELHELNMGATAIGTGINSPPGYAELVTRKLTELTGLPLLKADNLVEATQDSGAFAQMSGNMKRAAVQISKVCNDLRWLSSGPRCGLYEITLPPMQAGSSIMPGKVNPVIPEVVNQICYQIIGYDVSISMAAEASELELNMAEPIMAYNLLHGLMLLKNACIILAGRCIEGIKPNRERCRAYVENSIGLVTALNPVIGYEKSVAIAKEALESGRSVYDLVVERGLLSKRALDEILQPDKMTHPRRIAQSDGDSPTFASP